MATLEYKAECLCGGGLTCSFKKPTRMQHSVSFALCDGCGSRFMFSCAAGANENGRYYKADHVLTKMTDSLKQKLKQKKEALNENNPNP